MDLYQIISRALLCGCNQLWHISLQSVSRFIFSIDLHCHCCYSAVLQVNNFVYSCSALWKRQHLVTSLFLGVVYEFSYILINSLTVLKVTVMAVLTSFLRFRDRHADSLFLIIRCWRFTALSYLTHTMRHLVITAIKWLSSSSTASSL